MPPGARVQGAFLAIYYTLPLAIRFLLEENRMADFSIDPRTSLGPVHLIVSDLRASLPFYTDTLGFQAFDDLPSGVTLVVGGETPLVVLRELKGAQRKPARSTGLYHFAVLLPSRADLARELRHLAESGYPLQGAADHLVSEALYLADPDGNGIEIYADRPRDRWPRTNGTIRMGTDPLNVESLMSELQPDGPAWSGMPERTQIGHVHLHVADLQRAVDFYHGVLGFDLVTRYGPQAAFLSAGGYHHHIGLNTWAGVGAPPPPAGSVGLDYFTIYLPGKPELDQEARQIRESGTDVEEKHEGLMVRDPSENAGLMEVEPPRVAGR